MIPDLKEWIDGSLNEILDHFIGVFDDEIDKDFWNQIYKCNDFYLNYFIYFKQILIK